MSRCRCCNNPLSYYGRPRKNPHTGKEEDLCSNCVFLAHNAQVEREYVGGASPVEGVTTMKDTV